MPVAAFKYDCRGRFSGYRWITAGFVGAVVGLALAGAAFWLFKSKGYDPSLLAFLAFGCLFLVVGVSELWRMRFEDRESKTKDFFDGCIAGFMVLAFMLGFTTMLNQTLSFLPAKHLNWLAVAVLPIGYIVARYKRRNQLRYGWIEVGVGVLSALGTINSQPEFRPVQLLTIVGALYVVARGFGNIYEASQRAEAARRKLIEEADKFLAARSNV
jgi:hypothetical protein